jgi:CRISPR/Cas system-associated exonuclease Cas4 (RecB family)
MVLRYETYPFSPVLGWSLSRYEVFDKCKRQYFYQYYSRHVTEIPAYKISQLKQLTSVALEIGNVVHDVMEAFLKRLQKDDSSIDEQKFYDYARQKAASYFSTKTFVENYYEFGQKPDLGDAISRINVCLSNFMKSPCFTWLFMKAIINKENWMIEPPGYGETRLDGLKAYCKMDFLFPVDKEVYILDWKTGRKDTYKHSRQLIGYAAAASNNFGITFDAIVPKIIYLQPDFDEFELKIRDGELEEFFKTVKRQTDEMCALCKNPAQNIPSPMDAFPATPSPSMCNYCNFRELCHPGKKGPLGSSEFKEFDIAPATNAG